MAFVDPWDEKWAKSTLSIQFVSSPPKAGSRKSRSHAFAVPQLKSAVCPRDTIPFRKPTEVSSQYDSSFWSQGAGSR